MATYTCPVDPEVRQEGPGDCPKCGMALEPRDVALDAPEDEDLRSMTRRFWASAARERGDDPMAADGIVRGAGRVDGRVRVVAMALVRAHARVRSAWGLVRPPLSERQARSPEGS